MAENLSSELLWLCNTAQEEEHGATGIHKASLIDESLHYRSSSVNQSESTWKSYPKDSKTS